MKELLLIPLMIFFGISIVVGEYLIWTELTFFGTMLAQIFFPVPLIWGAIVTAGEIFSFLGSVIVA